LLRGLFFILVHDLEELRGIVSLGSHMSEKIIYTVRELAEDSIDTFVNVELGFIVNSITIDQPVVLEGVGMDCKFKRMHLGDKWRERIIHFCLVPDKLLIFQ